MSFRPEVLLSKAARARCVANLKELPSMVTQKTPESEKVYASVLVPLCVHNGELCLLYTLRSSNLTNHRGQVSFPGGKRDENETVVDTALRETEEEIGFPRESVDVWGEMNHVQGRNSKMFITPVVGQLLNFDLNKLAKNDDEVEAIFAVSMASLCNQENHAHYMHKSFPLPVYLCGKHRVWGITGMITHMFLQCFLPEGDYKPNFMRHSYQLDELMPSKI